MRTTTIVYDAKCKDCHFHQGHFVGKRFLTKCLYGCFKVESGSFSLWTIDQKDAAPKTTLKTKACDGFILWGTSESKVNEIIIERQSAIVSIYNKAYPDINLSTPCESAKGRQVELTQQNLIDFCEDFLINRKA